MLWTCYDLSSMAEALFTEVIMKVSFHGNKHTFE